MASAVIHMCVAKKVNEKLKMSEKDLMLGSIAPDLWKLTGSDKSESHFLLSEEEYSVSNYPFFITKYQKYLNKPFEMGYLIHLLTDSLWFSMYVNKYIKKYCDKKNIPFIDYTKIKPIIYDDFTNLNPILIDDYKLDLYQFANDFPLPVSSIDEIPVDKLNVLKEKVASYLTLDISSNYQFKILKIDEINEFIEKSSNAIISILKWRNVIDI